VVDLGIRGKQHILSEMEEVSGTEPVSRTIIIPSVSRAMPRDLEKYSSRTILC
jgi:hypothetical protein